MNRRDRRVQQGYHPELVSDEDSDTDSEHSGRYDSDLSLDRLVPFANHPFKLYEGTRLNDMVESIKENVVMTPVIVRPAADGKYEILSGHNRVNAARGAELQTIPAIIRSDLNNDDEAMLFVTESNLIQRSSSEMAHSELANAIAMQYEAMKKRPGYRSDLVEDDGSGTCALVASRSRTAKVLGDKYGLSGDKIKRYLRISKLTSGLLERLDNGEIAKQTAVSLSYLCPEEQEYVEQLLAENQKLSMGQAKTLRDESSNGELSPEVIEQILTQAQAPAKAKSVKLSREFCSQYFNENQTAEEIESVIAEALEMYFSKNG